MGFHGEVSVTYQGGAFRPDGPLDLPEGARATVLVPLQAPTAESRRAAWELIERIRREKLVRLGDGRFSREDLYDRH